MSVSNSCTPNLPFIIQPFFIKKIILWSKQTQHHCQRLANVKLYTPISQFNGKQHSHAEGRYLKFRIQRWTEHLEHSMHLEMLNSSFILAVDDNILCDHLTALMSVMMFKLHLSQQHRSAFILRSFAAIYRQN